MPEGPNRFEALDSFRGLAALAVAVGHFWINAPLTSAALIRNSTLYVDFFFVLSGFVIAWNYRDKLAHAAQAWRFMLLRIGRLYPLHLASLLALLALRLLQFLVYPKLLVDAAFGPSSSMGALASNIVLAQSLGVHDMMTWNEPSWSISAEMIAYAAFALACVAGARTIHFLIGAAVFGVATVALPRGMESTADFGVLRCFYGFCVGVVTSAVFRSRDAGYGWWEAVIVCVCLAFVATKTDATAIFAPLLFGVLVYVFAGQRGPLTAALRTAPLRFLGRISYSIYMTHWLVADAFWIGTNFARQHLGLDGWGVLDIQGEQIQVYGANPIQGWAFLIAYLAAVVAVSALTYSLIEEPFRAWSRVRVQRLPESARSLMSPRT